MSLPRPHSPASTRLRRASTFHIPQLRQGFAGRVHSIRAGFTMIEMLIVVALIAIIGAVMVRGISGSRDQRELDSTALQIASLLREMQSKSMAQASSSAWGVHFENATATIPFFAPFAGTYGTSTRSGYFALPRSLTYSTSTVPSGGSVEVNFAQLSGTCTSTQTVNIYLITKPASSSTIVTATSGTVTY